MVSVVGTSVHSASTQHPSYAASGGKSVAALEGRIELDKIQLNDWTTCVSAKTSKGQAAIQKLSGEIGAVKEQITRALQASPGAPSLASATSNPDAQRATGAPAATTSAPSRPGSLDVWA
jgi:hypothetical protein